MAPRRTTRVVPVLAFLLLLLALLPGCSDDTDSGSALGPGDSSSRQAAPGLGTSSGRVPLARARVLEQRVLDARVRAVRRRDEAAFLSTVDRRDAGLVARQRQYFDNLVQLPLATFDYRVQEARWDVSTPARWGRDVRVPVVRLRLRLQGYDAVPVERTVGFAFAFHDGRATIVADRSARGRPLFQGAPDPWDLTAVTVRRAPGVLGVFDRATAPSAATVIDAVHDGITSLDRALPFSWPGRVVVYSVADPQVLASFTDVPGGSLQHLGALTFPTYSRDRGSPVASTRMLVLPSSVRAGQPFLGRIVRHELSHVAIGTRDDGAPTWVSEGIAEYLGARDLPQRDKMMPTSALARATAPSAGMPASEAFNGADQEWHYALSWMACDQIVATTGEGTLWRLVEAMHAGGAGTTDARQDQVLRQVLGYDGRVLARRASARILRLYG